MRFKKRYLLFLPVVAILSFFQSGCLSFRTPDERQAAKIKKKANLTPSFHTYKVGKRTIHYTQVGGAESNNKPLIVFVHGSPGSSDNFLDYLADEKLYSRAQLISVDRPGFGYSNYGKVERSLEGQSLMMKPLIEKMRGNRKVLLAGHSLGGPLVARMAMDYPQLIDGIVMIAPSIDPELEPKEWHRPIIDFFLIRWMFPKSITVSNQEIMPLKGELQKMLPLWKNITMPAMVVQGDKDTFVPPGNADFAKKMLTNSSRPEIVMIPKANHFIVWSFYADVRDAILRQLDFIESNESK